MEIAIIGVGNMGGGMAANLVREGHAVRAFDVAPDALRRVEEQGAMPCQSVGDAVRDAEVVLTMLPTGAVVEQVLLADVIGHVPSHALLIDSSTIDVATTGRLGEAAEAAGHAFVDAPVSGGIAAADAGTLTFMVGGSSAAFDRARPILCGMGKAVIHAGKIGAGQIAKACNNMILAATMIATAEAFTLAEKLGLEPQTFYDIASTATGQSWSMTSYCPVPGVGPDSPADRDYQGGFATALMLKDLGLAMAAARSVGATVPMGERAEALYRDFAEAGHGTLDFSAIIRTLA